MKVGLLVTPGTHAQEAVRRAEEFGFDSAWFVDSPVIFGDPFVSMAATAAVTKRIALATGVTNPVLRIPPVLAASLASLNALAPGRIILGIGTGFTSTGALGLPPAKVSTLARFVAQTRALLSGEVAEITLADGSSTYAEFINKTLPWVELTKPIPLYIAAAGPNIIPKAAVLGDAVLLGGITEPTVVAACIDLIRDARREAGLDPDAVDIAITPSVFMTDRDIDIDDDADFEELREVLGPKSLAPAINFSRIAQMSARVPSHVAEALVRVRKAYKPPTNTGDPATRHLRAYRGYMTALNDEQRPLITREVLKATTICGSASQCLAQMRELEKAGIGHIVLSPLPQHVDSVLTGMGRNVLPALKGGTSA